MIWPDIPDINEEEVLGYATLDISAVVPTEYSVRKTDLDRVI